ncbi:hypothetical protein HOP50_11g63330 [Chloropicon primus]|uniref:Uncharacterized protein n=1 Tax=Chloropicon primus TaxID=1764295 RepID=A0A5B8MTB2_9CHLO|nr:hypothetical protein A3770_11p63110 [Chloropicon primus]UPR03006.1 hypothetical protein HOP50_11g63330 [Chloropicon primus]|eukprot:QDZ23793.1 hypothetical protein A3770_11p63110 [Chloropicon primus]
MYKASVVVATMAVLMVAGASAHKVDLNFLNNIEVNIPVEFDNGNTYNLAGKAEKLLDKALDVAENYVEHLLEGMNHEEVVEPTEERPGPFCRKAVAACKEDAKQCFGALKRCPHIKRCAAEKKKCWSAIKECKEDKDRKECREAKETCVDAKETCTRVIKGCKECWRPCGAAKAKCAAAKHICHKKGLLEHLKDLIPEGPLPRRAGNPLILPNNA